MTHDEILTKNMELAGVIRALRANAREDAARIERLERERDEAREELAEAKREAENLAKSIYRSEYSDNDTDWELLDSVAGVISQIDNMYAGVREQRDEAREALMKIEDRCVDLLNRLERERAEAREDLEFRRGLYKVQEECLDRAKRERDEARAVAKLAYSILAKVNRRSLEDAAARSSIKHINNTPMEWLYSIIQNWEATQ